MTQQELASKAGVSLSAISRAETGYAIKMDKVARIARALVRQDYEVALSIGETRDVRQQHQELMSIAAHNRERIEAQTEEMKRNRERRRIEAENQGRRRYHLFEWADHISLDNTTGEDDGPYIVRRLLGDLHLVLKERQREREERGA